ncbi:hypothetical protein KJ910_00455 [Patescibacteria group bacterium]|nr:hypothetical protein [Patescibacteria group bacterium]
MASPDIDRAAEFFRRFRRFGGSDPTLSKLLGDDELMEWWLKELNKRLNSNPFELIVEEQLAALRKQNELGNWGITEDVFERLAKSAPEWPEGRDAYRSFRIRFGEGRDGMIQTFEAHVDAIRRVHDKFWRWEQLLSGAHPHQGEDVERLRLLAGNDTHHAVVEWMIVDDLSANRQRQSITAVRNSSSLADEGLVMAWLFPERVQAIDYDKWSAWFCAGYELNVPGFDSWADVPIVYRGLRAGRVWLYAHDQGIGHSGYSGPASRE